MNNIIYHSNCICTSNNSVSPPDTNNTPTPTPTSNNANITPTPTPTITNTSSSTPTVTPTKSLTPTPTPSAGLQQLELFSWGRNTFAKLGDNSYVDRLEPTGISNDTWKDVSAGYGFSIAINKDNLLYGWGATNLGSLADLFSSPVHPATPTQIGNQTWQMISAGGDHCLAIGTDNRLYAWGYNPDGRVGNNTINPDPNNQQVNEITQINNTLNWKSVSAGNAHSLAIDSINRLWSWGNGSLGRLGISQNPFSNRLSPTLVTNTTTWSKVSAGIAHSLATMLDGSLWVWGANTLGELGVPATPGGYIITPTMININNQFYKISAGNGYNLAIAYDGSLWAWGSNDYGQLGDGTTTLKTSPVKISDDEWIEISAGWYYSLGIKADKTLWGWGINTYGQLGDNTTQIKLIPTKIGSDSWEKISVKFDHSLGLKIKI